eukprot:m.72458 g.72458  ORF g.72458 m.72458 type:complete len:73 (-) comp12330_c0_seq1:12-230(-)
MSEEAKKEKQAKCLHKSWTYVNTNKGADGLDEVMSQDYVCTSCSKVLAKESECISFREMNVLGINSLLVFVF